MFSFNICTFESNKVTKKLYLFCLLIYTRCLTYNTLSNIMYKKMDIVSEKVKSMTDDNTKYKKRIMEAAVKLFRENGYDSTSVNDICKEAGIARSTFYLNVSNKKEIVHMILANARLDRDDFFSDFVAAENDFERMWILCNRYLTVAIEFGPELSSALFRLELMGELDILGMTHKVDEWMIQLASNCQKSGVILNKEPADILAPLSVDVSYYTTYEWSKNRGSFNLRQVVRRRAESTLGVAPEYRMSDEQLAKL